MPQVSRGAALSQLQDIALSRLREWQPGFDHRVSQLVQDPVNFLGEAITDVIGDPRKGSTLFGDLRLGKSKPTTPAGIESVAAANARSAEAFDHAMNIVLGLATVYHGSPYKFDQFDASKIGTGEGAQAYGHGLYFAENPEVAKGYHEALSKTQWKGAKGEPIDVGTERWYDWRALDMAGTKIPPGKTEAQHLLDRAADLERHGQFAAKEYGEDTAKMYFGAAERLRRMASEGVKAESSGALYKVDIPDEHIAKMLDWDKPLSQQPESVRKAIEQLPHYDRTMTGGRFYESLSSELRAKGGADYVSQRMSELGIPGIRYLDGGSRGAGTGTSNYVLFDPQHAKILERK